MDFTIVLLCFGFIKFGVCADIDTGEEYVDSSKTASASSGSGIGSIGGSDVQLDAEDYDQYEINEADDMMKKTYHCSARTSINETGFDRKAMEILDDNGLASIRLKRHHYQVRGIRKKMCQAGFNPFKIDKKLGSINKRFKNTIRLMIYNTPGVFPGLIVVRSDLDRKRKREPQIWFKFEMTTGPLSAEFDYDNYFVTITGDFSRIQAFSKMLVALKMHKKLNNFNDSVSYKINLDLGIIEIIYSNLGTALMKDKKTTNLLVKALNGIRTEVTPDGNVQIEFEESMKKAVDQIDPFMYSSIWLQSMAEKLEVVKMKDKTKSNDKFNKFNGIL